MTKLVINGESFQTEDTESSVWKIIGKELSEADCPSTVHVELVVGNKVYGSSFNVAKRGTWTDDDGTVHPSKYITHSCGDVIFAPLQSSKYAPVYLTCIHPQSNNYKAYYLEQRPDGQITARYESIDKFLKGQYREVKDPYPSYMFWVRYFEKISKGYVDQSTIYFDGKVTTGNKTVVKKAPTTASEKLYKLLYDYAYHTVEQTLVSVHVTNKQVKEARKIWKKLGTLKTVRAFNKHLQELLVISPRKRNPLQDNVADFLAKDKSDMATIIAREDSLIAAMETLAGSTSSKPSAPSFKDFGIDVFEATKEQYDEVMRILGTSSLPQKVSKVWRVKPLAQEKRFAKYCKTHHIHAIKKLWHGSRNENWANIIKESLSLNPNAQITGKMFGKGIYFAPSPTKSFNYTSYHGTYWAKGTSDKGYMGIFATAYGTPNFVSNAGEYAQTCGPNAPYDCVHAKPENTGLRADEIVFYDEDAVCLNYLIEFA